MPFLFSGLLMSMATPMSFSALLLERLMKPFALSALHTHSWVALGGLASANRHLSPALSSVAVSLGMNFAHVYEVAVSLRVSIFCFSRSMTSVAKCWPKAVGGVTDDIRGLMCF